MRGFGKRPGALTACLLACLLTVTAWAAPVEDCTGDCTHQAAVGTVHYDTLEETLSSAGSGSAVVLLRDMALSAPITLEQSVAIDLGGNTLSGNLIFTAGGTVRNGTVKATEGSCVQVSGCTVAIEKDALLEGCGTAPALLVTAGEDTPALVNLSGTLTGKDTAPLAEVKSEDGKCELYVLKNARLTAEENPLIVFDSEGKLEISEGTLQAEKDLIRVNILEDRKTVLSVTGGKLLSEEGEAVVVTAEENARIPEDFVTGGTYKKVPTAYVPDWCVIRDNGDSTYTVLSSYTLTFLSGGASGTMEPASVRCGSAYTLPTPGFTAPEGQEFAGWLIGSKTYTPGDSFTPQGDTQITAQWKDHVHTGGTATCQKKAVCESCGKSYGELGSHKLSSSGGYAATCTATGMNAHSRCSVCGGYFVSGVEVSAYSLTTPALGHSWQTVEGKPATCTEEGRKEHRKCAECGMLQIAGVPAEEADTRIPAVGHTLEAVDATLSTCTEPGIQAHERCIVCNGQFLKGQEVQAQQLTTALSSHVLSDWISDESYHWKACVDCQEVYRQSRHADTDADGSCDDCGYAMAVSAQTVPGEKAGFSWLLLIPIVIAATVAVPLIVKKRKEA